jgi:hypothetical protein
VVSFLGVLQLHRQSLGNIVRYRMTFARSDADEGDEKSSRRGAAELRCVTLFHSVYMRQDRYSTRTI